MSGKSVRKIEQVRASGNSMIRKDRLKRSLVLLQQNAAVWSDFPHFAIWAAPGENTENADFSHEKAGAEEDCSLKMRKV